MMRYIGCAEMHNKERLFIKNYSPLLWTKNIFEAKSFERQDECKAYLEAIDKRLEGFIKGQSDIYYGIHIIGYTYETKEIYDIECYL